MGRWQESGIEVGAGGLVAFSLMEVGKKQGRWICLPKSG